LDGPLPKLCPAVALSHQDGHYSAVALLLKAALILVSDYRLLGASGFIKFYVKLRSAVQPSWSEGGTNRHNFGRGPFNDYFIKVWFQLSNWFQTRRFLCEFPIGSYVKLSSAVGTKNLKKIFSSETTEPISTKLC
jgi:hypothetical protein